MRHRSSSRAGELAECHRFVELIGVPRFVLPRRADRPVRRFRRPDVHPDDAPRAMWVHTAGVAPGGSAAGGGSGGRFDRTLAACVIGPPGTTVTVTVRGAEAAGRAGAGLFWCWRVTVPRPKDRDRCNVPGAPDPGTAVSLPDPHPRPIPGVSFCVPCPVSGPVATKSAGSWRRRFRRGGPSAARRTSQANADQEAGESEAHIRFSLRDGFHKRSGGARFRGANPDDVHGTPARECADPARNRRWR